MRAPPNRKLANHKRRDIRNPPGRS
jgi:hypothetical protein